MIYATCQHWVTSGILRPGSVRCRISSVGQPGSAAGWDRQGEVFMTDMAFSAAALDANRAGRLGPDQLRDLQASVRYRRRGLVGHLLRSAGRSRAACPATGSPRRSSWHRPGCARGNHRRLGQPVPEHQRPRRRHAHRRDGHGRGTGGPLASGSCRTRGHRCHGRVDGHRRVGRGQHTDPRHQRPGAEPPALASLTRGDRARLTISPRLVTSDFGPFSGPAGSLILSHRGRPVVLGQGRGWSIWARPNRAIGASACQV
jgi:hypothetical protein